MYGNRNGYNYFKHKCVKIKRQSLNIYIPWGLNHPRFHSWEVASQRAEGQGNWCYPKKKDGKKLSMLNGTNNKQQPTDSVL